MLKMPPLLSRLITFGWIQLRRAVFFDAAKAWCMAFLPLMTPETISVKLRRSFALRRLND
jgi:hypothetical protein